MDVLTKEQRRLNMSRIRGKDTRPELALRRGLHAAGLRFRLHARDLPGTPDIVFPRHGAVVLVHGCFWHGHDCPMFKMPGTRQDFWSTKIAANQERDRRAMAALRSAGWRIMIVWECSLKGIARLQQETVIARCERFVVGCKQMAEVKGKWPADRG